MVYNKATCNFEKLNHVLRVLIRKSLDHQGIEFDSSKNLYWHWFHVTLRKLSKEIYPYKGEKIRNAGNL